MKPDGMKWRYYLRDGLGRRLSQLGERFNIPALTYNRIHFYMFHDQGLQNAGPVVEVMREIFPEARRWVDVGAGTGAYAAEAQRKGISVLACEKNKAGRRLAMKQGVDARDFDLTSEPPADLPGEFDLAYCFEVAEHLPEKLGLRLVRFLAELAPTVYFTAAHPGQGGTDHINEQPQAYWIERFAEIGMTVDLQSTKLLLAALVAHKVPAQSFYNNSIVFKRASESK